MHNQQLLPVLKNKSNWHPIVFILILIIGVIPRQNEKQLTRWQLFFRVVITGHHGCGALNLGLVFGVTQHVISDHTKSYLIKQTQEAIAK
jgi:hypothetical protein